MTDTPNGCGDGEDVVHFEARMPGTRQFIKLAFVATLVAVFAVGSGDPIVSAVIVVLGGWLLVHDLVSAFGWERIVLTESSLLLERRLFGAVLKRVELERLSILALEFAPKPSGLARFDESEDRDQDVWSFDSGPIVVTTETAIYRVGQGLIKDRETAHDIVERLNVLCASEQRKRAERLEEACRESN